MGNLPRILGVGTAVPPHKLTQAEIVAGIRRVFPGNRPGNRHGGIDRMLPVYGNAGVDTRYSCVPFDWYAQAHGWAEKNDLYLRNALDLLTEAAGACLEEAGAHPHEVDAVVCVSTSGIATPSLDARLIGRLDLRPDVQRLPVFGLGCAGGVLGLARAAALARAAPETKVLFLVVELCGLTFRRGDASKSNVVATALFGDGAAAALVGCTGDGPRIGAWGEHTWPDSLDVMGWRVEDDGLGVLFSRRIPDLIRADFRTVAEGFLERHGLGLADLDGFLCHPGGAKVIDALEDALDLPRGGLDLSRGILRDYGNLSAATVMFVLARALRQPIRGQHLMSAVGPGFSAGFLILEVP